ncbi:SCO3242 family prenyltransferase [Streptomyces sp. NPDC006332]|uniref:SCO3242 family prenyltransferase n=1 Tax=Streptomyces sp. NPDC006332 TaxID=3155456 RepID=UPI0033BBAC4F
MSGRTEPAPGRVNGAAQPGAPVGISGLPAPPPPESRTVTDTDGSVGTGPAQGAVGVGAWAELLRLPALFTVPGDVLAGAAAVGARVDSRTLLAIGSSLCLYQAGMALNDWADRAEDAAERPHRPLPSGRIRPTAALTAACALTGAGLSLSACAGRPALAVAVPLAATVWAYDLALKHTPAGPFAMATARGLDLLLGAAATTGTNGRSRTRGTTPPTGTGTGTGTTSGTPLGVLATLTTARNRAPAAAPSAAASRMRRALPSAALLGTHTLAVTTVSRRETTGGSPLAPLGALATTAVLTRLLTHPARKPSGIPDAIQATRHGTLKRPAAGTLRTALATTLAASYAATAARPYLHATLNPSPQLTQRAVGGGIRATIPLQSALTARSGASVTALLTAALAPLAARFAKKVSVT